MINVTTKSSSIIDSLWNDLRDPIFDTEFIIINTNNGHHLLSAYLCQALWKVLFIHSHLNPIALHVLGNS